MSSTVAESKALEYTHHPNALDGGIKSAFIDLMAGSAGGIACVLVGQPLDTVKVKMQSFPHLHRNTFECFRHTIKSQHFIGLYAGTTPALVANVAENSVLFAAYGICQKAMQIIIGAKNVDELSPLANAGSGFFAAFFSSITLCPTELIKCKLQTLHEMKSSQGSIKIKANPWFITKGILKVDGIRGMFKGFLPTVGREMPGYFFFFGGYELSRTLFAKKGQRKEEIGTLPTIISGGIGGMALWVAIFPFDLIKSRMQISESQVSAAKIMKEVIQTKGNGLCPTLIRTFPASGALFLAYEWTKFGLDKVL